MTLIFSGLQIPGYVQPAARGSNYILSNGQMIRKSMRRSQPCTSRFDMGGACLNSSNT